MSYLFLYTFFVVFFHLMCFFILFIVFFFFFQAEDGIRDGTVTGVQTCALPISAAYEVLSDPEKRRMYDLGGDPFGRGGAGQGAGFSFTDIMDAFFGGQAGGATQGRGPRPRTRQIGRASCRERVEIAGVDEALNK